VQAVITITIIFIIGMDIQLHMNAAVFVRLYLLLPIGKRGGFDTSGLRCACK
jgi:hypothetical protein